MIFIKTLRLINRNHWLGKTRDGEIINIIYANNNIFVFLNEKMIIHKYFELNTVIPRYFVPEKKIELIEVVKELWNELIIPKIMWRTKK